MSDSGNSSLGVLLLTIALCGVGAGWYYTDSNLKTAQRELQQQVDDLSESLALAEKKAKVVADERQKMGGGENSATPFVSESIVEELASCRIQLEAAEARNAELTEKLAKWEAWANQRAAMKARQQAERERQNADNAASLEAMRAHQAERQLNLDGKREAERFQGRWRGYYFFSDGITSKGWYARGDLSALGNEGAEAVEQKIRRYEAAREDAYKRFGETGLRKYQENDKILERMYNELRQNPKKLRK